MTSTVERSLKAERLARLHRLIQVFTHGQVQIDQALLETVCQLETFKQSGRYLVCVLQDQHLQVLPPDRKGPSCLARPPEIDYPFKRCRDEMQHTFVRSCAGGIADIHIDDGPSPLSPQEETATLLAKTLQLEVGQAVDTDRQFGVKMFKHR